VPTRKIKGLQTLKAVTPFLSALPEFAWKIDDNSFFTLSGHNLGFFNPSPDPLPVGEGVRENLS
jgi:hypothetical protein